MVQGLNAAGAATQMFSAAAKGAIVSNTALRNAMSLLLPAQIAHIAATQGLSQAQLVAMMTEAGYSKELQEEILLQYGLDAANQMNTGSKVALATATKILSVAQDGGLIKVRELIAAFKELTPLEIANIAAKNGLSKEQLMLIMTQAEYSEELKEEILLHYEAATGGTLHAGANNALAFSFKNLLVAMKPMLIMAAIAAAAFVLYKAIDRLAVTAQEAQDAFNDANNSLQEYESNIESLSGELNTVGDKLKELERIARTSTLTPNQEQEMANLKVRNDELQRQLDIEEKLAQYAQDKASQAAEDAIKKTTYQIGTGEMTMLSDGTWLVDSKFVDGATAIEWYNEQLADAYKRRKEIQDQILDPANAARVPELEAALAVVNAEITGYEQTVAVIIREQQAWANAITDTTNASKIAINAAIDEWYKLTDANGEYIDTGKDAKDVIVDLNTAIGNFSSSVESIKKVQGILDALDDVNGSKLPIDIYNDIITLYPEAAAEINNVADAQAFLNKKIQDMRHVASIAYGQIRISNKEWLAAAIESSDVLKKNLAIMYEEDLDNFNDLAKQKWFTEKGLVKDLMALWYQYTVYTTAEIEAMLQYENYEAFNPNMDRIRALQNVLELRKQLEEEFDGLGDFVGDDTTTAADKARSAFEKVYRDKKHELDMEKITIKEFYDWLGGQDGYQKYFEAQGDTLEDFQKYAKEVFDGLRDVHEDYLDYLDYEIDVLERQGKNENAIIEKYNEKRALIIQLADAHRKYLESLGMSEVDILSNDQYQSYMDMLHDVEDEVGSIQDDAYSETKSMFNDLIDLTEEYIRKLKEDEIEALEEQQEAYSEILETRKKLLDSIIKQDNYERNKNAKLKEMQKIEERMAALDKDGSREALLEKAELAEKLNDLQMGLDDMQTDHFVDTTTDAFDEAEKAFEKNIEARIDTINDFLDDNEAVNKAALKKLDNMNKSLFNNLLDYATTYTDTTRSEMLAMWDEVTAAAEKYGSVTNAAKVYEDGSVKNDVQTELNRMRRNGQEYGAANEDRRKWLANDSLEAGKKLEKLLGVPVRRDDDGIWWIGSGDGKKKLFDVFPVEKHHVGTAAVGTTPTPKQNEVFNLLEKGETVLTKKHVETAWEFLKHLNPAKWVTSPLSKMNHISTDNKDLKQEVNVEVVMQPTVYGDMTGATMQVLRKEAYNVADIVASKLRK